MNLILSNNARDELSNYQRLKQEQLKNQHLENERRIKIQKEQTIQKIRELHFNNYILRYQIENKYPFINNQVLQNKYYIPARTRKAVKKDCNTITQKLKRWKTKKF